MIKRVLRSFPLILVNSLYEQSKGSSCSFSERPDYFNDLPLVAGYDYQSKEITNETYDPLKAAAEKKLIDLLGKGKSLIIRPGFIMGDRDH